MKSATILALCLLAAACQQPRQDTADLKTQKDSVSYAIGMDVARNLKRQDLDIDLTVLSKGLNDRYFEGAQVLTDSESKLITSEFRALMQTKHAEELKTRGDKNRKDGDAFLAENKKKPGIVSLSSGLQYKVMTMGSGRKPGQRDTVVVNYRGTLLDGTEFKRASNASFSLKGVIKGWTEGLRLMPEGSKWILYVPPDLAYGELGAGLLVPPNATLVFEIELTGVR